MGVDHHVVIIHGASSIRTNGVSHRESTVCAKKSKVGLDVFLRGIVSLVDNILGWVWVLVTIDIFISWEDRDESKVVY